MRRIEDSPRTALASAQLAVALAALPDAPDLIQDRISRAVPTDGLEPRSLLTKREEQFMPAAEVIVGLVYDEARERTLRRAI